jgi:hypothetical protein
MSEVKRSGFERCPAYLAGGIGTILSSGQYHREQGA